jgi:GDPmannose 4,6-dehydratase
VQPVITSNITGLEVLNLLEVVRAVNADAGFYQTSIGEMFGSIEEPMQSETTPLYPLRHTQLPAA